jgi:hypothetical protein
MRLPISSHLRRRFPKAEAERKDVQTAAQPIGQQRIIGDISRRMGTAKIRDSFIWWQGTHLLLSCLSPKS